jgi:predicted MFS family arabinose efflux permease
MKLFKQHIAPEQLQSAMAIFQSLIAVFMVVGPSLGVIVYQNFDIIPSIAVMGIAFLLSALVLFRLPDDAPVKPEEQAEKHIVREMKEGLQYVLRNPVLRTLCGVFALAGLAVGIAQTLGLFIVTERLEKPKEFLQFIMMVNGAAMLVGGAASMAISKRVSPQKMLAAGMLCSALCTVAIGYSTSVSLTLVMQFVNGLSFPIIQIAISTMMLSWSEQAYVGRVNGVLSPMFVGAMVIMMAAAGPLMKVMPLVMIYAVSGALMFAGMLLIIPIFKHKAPETAAQQPTPSGMGAH